MQQPFVFNGQSIAPGTRVTTDLILPRLNSRTHLAMPVHVIHGKKAGPRMFVSSAVHGDEINGIEITQRLLEHKSLRYLQGTLLVVPVVNVYGVIHQSRYLPDRRDLNRSFPGSETGSLAARVAHIFINQVIAHCSHGIDLHTGAIHRTNLPQIRANLDDEETAILARSFGAPVLLNSPMREGSLRASAAEMGIRILLYEAGEALRYDEFGIRAGLEGILNVMRELDMLRKRKLPRKGIEPFVARSSSWIRAPESGVLRYPVKLGARVSKGDILGQISDPYSQESAPLVAPYRGVVIGSTQIPLVHEGEALFHIARFNDDLDDVVDTLEEFELSHQDEELYEDPG
jgi:predicted deacylase